MTPRDELVELLAAELAEARETIGVLTERLSWFRAAVNDRDTALGIIDGKPPVRSGAALRLVP